MKYTLTDPNGNVLLAVESTPVVTEADMKADLDKAAKACESAFDEVTKYQDAMAVMSSEGFGEQAKAVAGKVWEKIVELFKRFITFLKKVGDFISTNVMKLANNLARLVKRPKPLTQEQIDTVVNTLVNEDKSGESALASTEANGQFADLRTANVASYQQRTGFDVNGVVRVLDDFLKENSYLITYTDRTAYDHEMEYSLHFAVDQFFGRNNVERLKRDYKEVSDRIKKAIDTVVTEGNVNGWHDGLVEPSRINFWMFADTTQSTGLKRYELAKFILTNYTSDTTIRLGKDSIDLGKVIIEECKINKPYAENALATVQKKISEVSASDTDDSKDMLWTYRKLASYISGYNDITNDVLKVTTTMVRLGTNIETLYKKIDRLLAK